MEVWGSWHPRRQGGLFHRRDPADVVCMPSLAHRTPPSEKLFVNPTLSRNPLKGARHHGVGCQGPTSPLLMINSHFRACRNLGSLDRQESRGGHEKVERAQPRHNILFALPTPRYSQVPDTFRIPTRCSRGISTTRLAKSASSVGCTSLSNSRTKLRRPNYRGRPLSHLTHSGITTLAEMEDFMSEQKMSEQKNQEQEAIFLKAATKYGYVIHTKIGVDDPHNSEPNIPVSYVEIQQL